MDTPAWRAVWELNGARWIQLKTLTNYGKVHEKANTQILQQKEAEIRGGEGEELKGDWSSWKLKWKTEKGWGKVTAKAEMFSEINSINRAKYF